MTAGNKHLDCTRQPHGRGERATQAAYSHGQSTIQALEKEGQDSTSHFFKIPPQQSEAGSPSKQSHHQTEAVKVEEPEGWEAASVTITATDMPADDAPPSDGGHERVKEVENCEFENPAVGNDQSTEGTTVDANAVEEEEHRGVAEVCQGETMESSDNAKAGDHCGNNVVHDGYSAPAPQHQQASAYSDDVDVIHLGDSPIKEGGESGESNTATLPPSANGDGGSYVLPLVGETPSSASAKSTGSTTNPSGDKKPELTEKDLSLWIKNISNTTKAAELKALFTKHGRVASAKIYTTKNKNAPTCFGYITMVDLGGVEKCVAALNNTELNGCQIRVEKAGQAALPTLRSPNAAPAAPTPGAKRAAAKSGTSGSGAGTAPKDSQGQTAPAAAKRPRITAAEQASDKAAGGKKLPTTSKSTTSKSAGSKSNAASAARRIIPTTTTTTASSRPHSSPSTRRHVITTTSAAGRERRARSPSVRRRVTATGSSIRVSTTTGVPTTRSYTTSRYSRAVAAARRTSIAAGASSRRSRATRSSPSRRVLTRRSRSRSPRDRRGVSPAAGSSSRAVMSSWEREQMIQLLRDKEDKHRRKEEELRIQREQERIKFEREKLERERLEVQQMRLEAQLAQVTQQIGAGLLPSIPLAAAAVGATGFVSSTSGGGGGGGTAKRNDHRRGRDSSRERNGREGSSRRSNDQHRTSSRPDRGSESSRLGRDRVARETTGGRKVPERPRSRSRVRVDDSGRRGVSSSETARLSSAVGSQYHSSSTMFAAPAAIGQDYSMGGNAIGRLMDVTPSMATAAAYPLSQAYSGPMAGIYSQPAGIGGGNNREQSNRERSRDDGRGDKSRRDRNTTRTTVSSRDSGRREDRPRASGGSRSDSHHHNSSSGRRDNHSSSSHRTERQQRGGGEHGGGSLYPRTDPSYASRMAAGSGGLTAAESATVVGGGAVEMFGSGLNPYGVNPPQGDVSAYHGYRDALDSSNTYHQPATGSTRGGEQWGYGAMGSTGWTGGATGDDASMWNRGATATDWGLGTGATGGYGAASYDNAGGKPSSSYPSSSSYTRRY